MPRYSKSKTICQLVEEYLDLGWTVEQGGKHMKLVAPSGHKFPIPGSPSDHRSEQNWRSQLKRFAAAKA